VSDWRIALSALNYGGEEEAALIRVLRSGWISMGPEVRAFETEVAKLQRVRHAFAVANGTGALYLALAALELEPGDEVIQPALNFVAAANMTIAVGAQPVFADIISLEEPTIDPAHIEALITSRTKAVIVMHYGGYLCRMAEIKALCRKHNLYLVEDACHALGAAGADGIMAGSIGDVSAFSFFSNKNLAIGEGGMVVTDRDDVANRVRLLRSHGMSTLSWDRKKGHAQTYDVSLHGFNYRLDDFHGALGRAQLKKLLPGNRRRSELSALYRQRLAQSPDLIVPFGKSTTPTANHLMPLLAPNGEARDSRDSIVAALKAEGIQTSFHYPSITTFAAFAQHVDADVPKSVTFASQVITLPLHAKLTDDDVEVVCSTLLASRAKI
jgi:dTDP-4-amino-4,6-dideoxygalactose transaminase